MPCVYLPGPAPAVTVANKSIFREFSNTVCRGFWKPVYVAWSVCRNPFVTALASFYSFLTNRIWAWEYHWLTVQPGKSVNPFIEVQRKNLITCKANYTEFKYKTTRCRIKELFSNKNVTSWKTVLQWSHWSLNFTNLLATKEVSKSPSWLTSMGLQTG